MVEYNPGSFINSIMTVVRYKSQVKLGVDSAPITRRTITLDEVSYHDKITDCWVIIYDRVYDLTDFLYEHPGGSDILLECGGRDATLAFRSSGHSKMAIRQLSRFLVGELPMEERIFRKPGGFHLSDLPD